MLTQGLFCLRVPVRVVFVVPFRDIGLVLTDNTTIQELNAAYRNKPTATDILSFPFHDVRCT